MIPDNVPRAIEAGRKFVISTHTNPDADGVAASVALCWLLWKLGRRAQLVITEALPGKFSFLEGMFPIARTPGPETADADTWMVVDASRFSRTGLSRPPEGTPLINIDHHADNECFGTANWVDAHAPAASEMVYWLLRECGHAPDREIAEALYTGILIDTGGFKFSNTGARAFQVCAELAACGVDCQGLYRTVFLDKSAGRMRLEGEIMRGAEMLFNGRLCAMEITENLLERTGTDHTDLEGVSNLTMQVKGVDAGVILIHNGPKIKVCLRSDGRINVGEVASFFGGGGHAAAAGCTFECPAAEVREKVLAKLAGCLK